MKNGKRIVMAICIGFLIWIMASYVNVITTNNDRTKDTSSWNFFSICFGEEEEIL